MAGGDNKQDRLSQILTHNKTTVNSTTRRCAGGRGHTQYRQQIWTP